MSNKYQPQTKLQLAANLQLSGSLVMEVLICLQISELKLMLKQCNLKLDEIGFSIEKLKESQNNEKDN